VKLNEERKQRQTTYVKNSLDKSSGGRGTLLLVLLTTSSGAGYDQIDVNACTNRGIKVSHTPNAVNDSTADLNMFLILGALRQFNAPMTSLRAGNWRGHCTPRLGHEPRGKTLGILGMGGIGRNLKKKAEAFSMRIIYHNRNRLSEELAAGAQYVGFEELLSMSDVISLNLPLNVSWCAYLTHR
jgi:glyoxylate reductase